LNAQLECEIADISDDDERREFMAAYGLTESGLDKLARAAYKTVGLISFLTAGEPEVRAWTIKRGSRAPQAAGRIHTDFERGFIRAEVCGFDDFVACGGIVGAKEKGKVRIEGKDYVVSDGDIIHFRFNV
jgi:ribosome-binding ATPase YchF (GTP1/OBG family)